MKLRNKVTAITAVLATSLLGATAANAADIPDPQGVLLDTVTATINGASSPSMLDLTNSAEWVDNGHLDGISSCAFSTDGADRAYKALTLRVVKAGHYTFRIVQTDPEFDGDISSSPMMDPYLALYREFDPAQLDDNVVGCNDDEYDDLSTPWVNGDTFPTNGVHNTNDRWSNFQADLTPGNYTVLLTTYGNYSSAAWSSIGTQSATFEYWGPNCGIQGATCKTASSGLANTGSDSLSEIVASFLLIAAGITVSAMRRKKINA